jgi:hypothetical protein
VTAIASGRNDLRRVARACIGLHRPEYRRPPLVASAKSSDTWIAPTQQKEHDMAEVGEQEMMEMNDRIKAVSVSLKALEKCVAETRAWLDSAQYWHDQMQGPKLSKLATDKRKQN